MGKLRWLTIALIGAVAGVIINQVLRRRSPQGILSRLPEPEEADAYNADDMQPPFEEHDPRQRPVKHWFRTIYPI